jgi:hypothetical protein
LVSHTGHYYYYYYLSNQICKLIPLHTRGLFCPTYCKPVCRFIIAKIIAYCFNMYLINPHYSIRTKLIKCYVMPLLTILITQLTFITIYYSSVSGTLYLKNPYPTCLTLTICAFSYFTFILSHRSSNEIYYQIPGIKKYIWNPGGHI